MSTQPTDAELKAMWQLHAADIGGIFYYARAVLAKWGQPAQAAEPVATQWLAEMIMSDCGCSTENQRLLDRIIDRIQQYDRASAAPQPSTAAQGDALSDSVRVPLDSLHADAAYLIGRLREGSMPYARVIEIIRERIDAAKAAIRASAAHGQAPADSVQEDAAREPLQIFDSPRAKALMRAFEEGWAACRDAEFVGEDAQNDAFNQSATVNVCLAEDWTAAAERAARAPADSVQEDAACWHWLAEYLVGTRTDLDDEIVASETVNDLRKLVKAAIKQGATK